MQSLVILLLRGFQYYYRNKKEIKKFFPYKKQLLSTFVIKNMLKFIYHHKEKEALR